MKIDPKKFGNRVRERRKELKWTQKRLGMEAGISQQHILFIEKGGLKNPQRQALQLAEALRLHVNWLLSETGPRETGPVLPSEDEFKAVYAALSVEGKEAVMAAAAKHAVKKLKSA